MKSAKKIAFDESGNTGSDLLDSDQPIFVLASVNLSEEEASELKSLMTTQSDELKFNRLKKYRKYWPQIQSLLNHDLVSESTVRYSVFHKEFCIWAYTVDHLVEPLAYNEGLDLYEGGANIAYANLLFFCTPLFCDKHLSDQYQKDFIRLFRSRDKESVIRFYSTVQALIASCKEKDYVADLAPLLASQEIIGQILNGWDNSYFDTTLSAFIGLIDYWGRRKKEKFIAFVDNSKSLTYSKPFVDQMRSIFHKQEEIGNDRRTLQVPLKLIDIQFIDSKNSEVVQIADLIAGAANHYFRSLTVGGKKDKLSEAIAETKLPSLIHNPVWPSSEIRIEDSQHGKKNLLEALVSSFERHHGQNL